MAVRQYKRKKGTSISKAKKYTYKGVDYKSGLEMYMAKVLTDHKIPFEYESVKYDLQPKFKFDNKCYERLANGKGEFINRGEKIVLPITYTPDFIGEGFIIETKGYANESFPMKWKFFKNLIQNEKSGVVLYKPQTQKECDETVKLILNNE